MLDFGLAKAYEMEDPYSPNLSNSPTISRMATQQGVILGTAAYMSPEQAGGKSVDKRADIWAFGVVFYEMVTGRSPFDGGDVTSTLAKVIESEPSWQGVPLKLQRLLKKCLEKDPRKRLRDIGDAWELLADAPASSTTPSVRRWLWPSTAAVLALAALVALWLAVAPTEPASGPLIRLDMDLGPNVTLAKVVPELASSFPLTARASHIILEIPARFSHADWMKIRPPSSPARKVMLRFSRPMASGSASPAEGPRRKYRCKVVR